jgi:hypothetical protein
MRSPGCSGLAGAAAALSVLAVAGPAAEATAGSAGALAAGVGHSPVAVGELLECIGPVYTAGARGSDSDVGGKSTPREALLALPRGPSRPLPLRGFTAISRDAENVTYEYRVNGKVRAAITVERVVTREDGRTGTGLGPWLYSEYAGCDPSEFSPDADDEIGIDLVYTQHGTRLPARLINMEPYPAACFPDASAIFLGRTQAVYARDPRHTLSSITLGPYRSNTTLPPTATDLGLRAGRYQLWSGGDARKLFAVAPGRVEEWPLLLPNTLSC